VVRTQTASKAMLFPKKLSSPAFSIAREFLIQRIDILGHKTGLYVSLAEEILPGLKAI